MDPLVSRVFRSNSGTSPVRNSVRRARPPIRIRHATIRCCVGLVGYDAPFTDVLPRSTAAPAFIFVSPPHSPGQSPEHHSFSSTSHGWRAFLEFARRALQRRGAKKELLRKRHNQLDQRNIRNEVAYRDRIGALFRPSFEPGTFPNSSERIAKQALGCASNETRSWGLTRAASPSPRSTPPLPSSSIYNTCYTPTATTSPPSSAASTPSQSRSSSPRPAA